ncbi:hypothetical protein DFH07DRAFT_1062205 [Mycena maculata]|uniref:Uncharacterized protein n=1 Tax=Mycena maculata TaxID=230809 RepID=A0AAD7IWC6_9AGAR|nr:hypothetical protein DFH07DRAFT_1062205 [Mycena maculata]
MDTARLEIMDSQRFDASKRGTNRPNLNIQTGLCDKEDASITSAPATPEGSWVSFNFRDSSPEVSDSGSDSLESTTPPTSSDSSFALEDDIDPKFFRQTDVFDKGDRTTTRTIIRPIPRSPILPGCFSRPSSPVTSRPSSPINFAALNCFSTSDVFAEEVDYMQVKRARELDGGEVEVRVHQVVSTDTEIPWIVRNVDDTEGLRRRAMEPRGTVSSP